MNPFKVGDRVRLKTGWTEMKVFKVIGDEIEARYLNYMDVEKHPRDYTDYTYWDGNTDLKGKSWNERKQQAMEITMSLYQVKGTQEYGTYLTTNSTGQMVLEMKGAGGAVKAFNKDELEEVVPYTIKVQGVTDTSYFANYEIAEGKVAKGDIIISESGNMYMVKELNTRSKSSKGEFKGRKLTTQEI